MANRSRWPGTPGAMVLAAALLAAGCGAAAPAASVVPAVSPAAVAPSPALTPVPGGQVPAAGVDPTEGEAMLLGGIRTDLRSTCAPLREGLPFAAVASVACTPATDQAVAVRVDMFDEPATMLDAYVALIEAAGVEPETNGGSCFAGEPAEGAWLPAENPAAMAERGGCWFNADGAPVYVTTQPPYVLITVTGTAGSELETAHAYAWLGNEDVPGAPTLWREVPVDAEK